MVKFLLNVIWSRYFMSYFVFYVRVKERVERNKYTLFTCNYVVSDRRSFLFLLVLGLPYFIVALPGPSI